MAKNNKTETNIKAVNIICEGTALTGQIETKGDIRFDGKLNGKILSAGRLVVGTTGYIEGDIHCDSIDLSGKIKGNIKADKGVTLRKGSVVDGNISSKNLGIEPGAVFNGQSNMNGENTATVPEEKNKE